MKKFMIFLLMAFLYLGTCQARSEAPHSLNANLPLQSWIAPTHSFSMDAVVVTISPSQPQSYCVSCPVNSTTFGASVDGLALGETVTGYRWYVNGNPTDAVDPTFTAAAYNVGDYSIFCELTTNFGTYRSNTVMLTVTSEIAANITGPTHACQNDIVTLTAQLDGTNTSPVTYQWRRNGNYIVGATSPTYSFSVADLPDLANGELVYEFDVQIVRNGCESFYSPVHYFSVSPTPVIFINAPLFCEGTTGTISADSYTSGDEQPYQWIWHHNGATDTTYVNTYNVTESGVYSVEAVYQDFACNSASRNTNVKTYQDSLGDLQPINVYGSLENVCLGSRVYFQVEDDNDPAIFGTPTYSWNVDGQPISANSFDFAMNFEYAGAHYVEVFVSYPNYPCQTLTDYTEINVTPAPTMVNITGVNVICSEDYTILFAHHDGGSGYSYLWSNGETTDRIEATSGVYTVTVTNQNGCQAVSDPFTVWEFGSDLQVATSETSVCQGQLATLNANADGWTGEISYEWSTGETGSTIFVQPYTTTTYTVTASVAYSNEGHGCSRTQEITVNVTEIPAQPSISLDDATICEGNQFSLSATSVEGAFYTWYENGIEIPGQNLSTITLDRPAGVYSYKVALTSADGCVSPVSNQAVVSVLSNPTVSIEGDALICAGTQVDLYANLNDANGTTGYTYQ